MNIITHLHNRVTSIVHAEDKSPAKILLLEDFYSIVLTRMSDRKEYNTLTNDDKMSGQKLTLYKLFHLVSWNDDNPAETIINNLVIEHDLNKNIVKSLLKEATPLIFSEIRNLANGQKTPEYLQSLLTNPETSFVNYLPEWAFALLPIATENHQLVSRISSAHAEKQKGNYRPIVISDEDAEFIKNKKIQDKKKAENKEREEKEREEKELEKQKLEEKERQQQELERKEREQKELEKRELERKEREQKELEKRELERKEREQKELEKRELERKEREQKELEKRELEKKEREEKERQQQELEKKEREQKELERKELEKKELDNKKTLNKQQTPPPFLPPPVPTETTEGYENIVVDENDDNETNTTATDNTGTIQKLMPIVGVILVGIIMWALLRGCQTNPDTTPMANSPATATENTSAEKTASSIQLSTNSSGKLQEVEIVTNNDNSANKITKLLKNNFDDFNQDDDNIQLDKQRKALMINNETLEKLLVLIKDKSDTSINIVGNDIQFTNKDDKEREKLIIDAQKVLAKFNSQSNDNKILQFTVNGQVVKLPTDDIAVIKSDKDESKSAELNIEEEVENSISASKKALHNLNGKPDIKVIEDALNTQIFNFAINDNQIPKANKPILNKASELLKKTNARIKITGHTDSDGDADYNKRLSEDRSFAVKKYLMIQGLPSSKIIAEGVGESKPIDSNDTDIGKFHNRRIEFEIKEIPAE